MRNIRVIVFGWGDTLMRDFPHFIGPMAQWPQVALVPGVAEALEQLPKTLVCCVASNAGDSDAELLGLALERVGIRKCFRYLFTSRELGVSKPDPAFFQEVFLRIGIDPQEAVVIGNDYRKDIVPAKAVGAATVWLHETGEPPPHSSDADVVIPGMKEFAAALANVERQTEDP